MGRGVLLDAAEFGIGLGGSRHVDHRTGLTERWMEPGEFVTAADLEAIEAKQGVRVADGDLSWFGAREASPSTRLTYFCRHLLPQSSFERATASRNVSTAPTTRAPSAALAGIPPASPFSTPDPSRSSPATRPRTPTLTSTLASAARCTRSGSSPWGCGSSTTRTWRSSRRSARPRAAMSFS